MASDLVPPRGPSACRTFCLPWGRGRSAIVPALTLACDGNAPTQHAPRDRKGPGTILLSVLPPGRSGQKVPSPSKPTGRWSAAHGSYPPPYLTGGERALDLLRLQPGRLKQMFHFNGLIRFGSQEGGVQGDIADAAAGDINLGKLLGIQPHSWRVGGEHPAPDGFALAGVGKWEVHREPQAALKSFIQG